MIIYCMYMTCKALWKYYSTTYCKMPSKWNGMNAFKRQSFRQMEREGRGGERGGASFIWSFSCFATRTSSWKIKILPSPVGRTVESRFRREYCLEQLTVQSLTLNEIKQYSTRPIDCVLSLRIPPFWSDRTGFILIISRFLIGWTVGGPLRRQYTSLCC